MISVVYKVERYRELLRERVKEGDVVIELGPHQGESVVYGERVKLGILVDKSEQAKKGLEDLIQKFPNLKQVQGDVRSFETITEVLKLTKECDFLALDIGGGRFPDTVFKVWAVWSGTFQPENSLIRNRGLGEFLQRVKVEDEFLQREFEEDGWLSSWGRATPSALKKQLQEFEFWVDV